MSEASGDVYLKEMKEAREVPAVLKITLIQLRASHPDLTVFVFEGIEDKKVYSHWIRRINDALDYEPLIAQGKGRLLKFMGALEKDRRGLGEGVFFFVDRDFDGLRGNQPARPNVIYITPGYSFENDLVNEDVLDGLLRDDLHCHGNLECRRKVVELFSDQYASFLRETRSTNLRLFLARKLGIELSASLPANASKLASIELEIVSAHGIHPTEIVALLREPNGDEIARLAPEFAALEPRRDYRGKFAMAFFRKWLHCVVQDRNSENSKYFRELQGEGLRAKNAVGLDALAALAAIPAGLAAFIHGVSARARNA